MYRRGAANYISTCVRMELPREIQVGRGKCEDDILLDRDPPIVFLNVVSLNQNFIPQ